MRKAIVTFVVGQATADMFNNYVYESWKRYAARHDYELIVLDEPVRPNALTPERPIVFQRLILFEHPALKGFDDVVYVDADIIINYRDAPCILSQHGGGGIGMTETAFDQGWVDPVEYTAFAGRMAQEGRCDGFADDQEALKNVVLRNLQTVDPAWQRAVFMNAGVLVLNRVRHADFLEDIFDRYNDDVIYPGAEQTILTYELLRSGNHTRLQDAFNRYWIQVRAGHYPFLLTGDRSPELLRWCVTAALCNSYFLHFAGPADVKDDMPMVDLRALEAPRGVFDI